MVAWMETVWPSSAEVRSWDRYSQELEAPWFLAQAQNVTQLRHKTPGDTRRRHKKRYGETGAQGGGGVHE